MINFFKFVLLYFSIRIFIDVWAGIVMGLYDKETSVTSGSVALAIVIYHLIYKRDNSDD
jgi:hypothetical protein